MDVKVNLFFGDVDNACLDIPDSAGVAGIDRGIDSVGEGGNQIHVYLRAFAEVTGVEEGQGSQ